MDCQHKIAQLREKINASLSELVGKKCILLDAPYYHNIGDVLIWTGVQCFIKDNNIECIYTASYETCTFPTIDKDVTVLFNGGGNLGDIYHEHMEFLLSVIRNYPENRIIVLPQTVYYKDTVLEKQDFKELFRHSDFYICGRDKIVYQHLVKTFGNHALLLPDMAFCISEYRLNPYLKKQTKKKLIIAREDNEKGQTVTSLDGDISDWPVFMHSFRRSTFLNKIFKRTSDTRIPIISNLSNKVWDWYASHIFNEAMIKEGVEFISPYREVETTRLHGCILSILLNKQVVLVNNSYGKNRNFYESWLQDLDTIQLKK